MPPRLAMAGTLYHRQSSPRAPTAVDRNDHAGHRSRIVRGEIKRCAGEILGLEERDLARRAVAQPLPMRIALRVVPVELIVDRRLERAWREAVHRDAVFGELARQSLCEIDDTPLGG